MTADPVDWDARYAAQTTPWDLGGPVPLLTEALDEGRLGRPGTALVPGAGRGYDAGALAAAGWSVTAVDLSPTAAGYSAEHHPAVSSAVGDALDTAFVLERTGGPVDLLWDHTFFCAVPLELRPRVAELADAVVTTGGLLASCVFPIGRPASEGGPPYAYDVDDLGALLEGFEQVHVGPEVTVPTRAWPHRLALWRRL
ncbi:thiopurine S-methyltransferase [Nocardioides sp. KR10-350]|uniref:thiopurine S-methyltransferase n=1 Tax=Nocardioides cheoyonin TaxID=3156615 RepID=UPI0032B62967